MSMKTKRFRFFKAFICSNEELHREMMYILKNVKLCRECFAVPSRADVCPSCTLKVYERQGLAQMRQCQSCLVPVFDVDLSIVRLMCSHLLCRDCAETLEQIHHNMVDYHPVNGITRYYKVKCPKCYYETKFDILGGYAPEMLT